MMSRFLDTIRSILDSHVGETVGPADGEVSAETLSQEIRKAVMPRLEITQNADGFELHWVQGVTSRTVIHAICGSRRKQGRGGRRPRRRRGIRRMRAQQVRERRGRRGSQRLDNWLRLGA